jgi:hypothetical protein
MYVNSLFSIFKFEIHSPGTWGFSPKREQWEKFITWYEEKSTKTNFHLIISDDIATDWYNENKKRGSLENMWSIDDDIVQ